MQISQNSSIEVINIDIKISRTMLCNSVTKRFAVMIEMLHKWLQ